LVSAQEKLDQLLADSAQQERELKSDKVFQTTPRAETRTGSDQNLHQSDNSSASDDHSSTEKSRLFSLMGAVFSKKPDLIGDLSPL
jgi:hypothetical protein